MDNPSMDAPSLIISLYFSFSFPFSLLLSDDGLYTRICMYDAEETVDWADSLGSLTGSIVPPLGH